MTALADALILYNLHRIRYSIGEHISGFYHVAHLCSDRAGYRRVHSSRTYCYIVPSLRCLADLSYTPVNSCQYSTPWKYFRSEQHALYGIKACRLIRALNVLITNTSHTASMLGTYTRLRKRLDKTLYRVKRYIRAYSRELSIFLDTSAPRTYSVVGLTCNRTADNELVLVLCLSYHILITRSPCFVSLPWVQQNRAYILGIIGLYRYSCICSTTILGAYRCTVSSICSLL